MSLAANLPKFAIDFALEFQYFQNIIINKAGFQTLRHFREFSGFKIGNASFYKPSDLTFKKLTKSIEWIFSRNPFSLFIMGK